LAYFTSKDVVAISMCAALWGVLNITVSPVFWTITHLPFACDLIGFTCLIIAVWWVKKLGAASAVGIIATAINFILRPEATHFIGFTAASILFDITTRIAGYKTCFGSPKTSGVCLIFLSVLSGGLAGFIIGNLFMAPGIIASVYGTLFVFAGLHATGGMIGGFLGFILVKALETRGVLIPKKRV